jgi:hypothetical protein
MDNVEIFYVTASDFRFALDTRNGSWHEDNMRENLYTNTGKDAGWTDAEIKASADELAGWYWWTCFPGCLPDSDASGPFKSSREARRDAADTLEEDED